MKILGIESSCDETSAAVVQNGSILLSNVVATQIDIHAQYGGVVPEVAARSHIEVINPVISQALNEAQCTWDDIDAIAVTYAPGLIGSLLVGVLAARTLAVLKNKPLYAIYHVEGHVYANFITDQAEHLPAQLELPSKQPAFPMLALIVSGLHAQLALFKGHGNYELLGQTQDDAIGEAFDKVAKMLGLPYPGGPSIAQAAALGNAHAYDFPKAKFTCTHKGAHIGMAGKAAPSSAASGTDSYSDQAAQAPTRSAAREVCHYFDYSFSGLKTAVLRAIQREVGVDTTFPSFRLAERLTAKQRHDFAASFQRVAVETVIDKTLLAYEQYQPASVVIAGGVAANQELRQQLRERLPIDIEYAPMKLCGDNGAMIASLAYYYAKTVPPVDPFTLEVQPSISMRDTAWAKV